MRVLFDENVPRPLRRHLKGHSILTVTEMGWSGLKNGRLIAHAEAGGFDVLLTLDQNIKYQQNMSVISLSVLVVVAPDLKIKTLLPLVPGILACLDVIEAGQICEVRE